MFSWLIKCAGILQKVPPDADKLVGYVAINASDMPLTVGRWLSSPMTFLPGDLARVLRFTLDGKLASAKGVVLDECRLVDCNI
jgi:hypothetical protein